MRENGTNYLARRTVHGISGGARPQGVARGDDDTAGDTRRRTWGLRRREVVTCLAGPLARGAVGPCRLVRRRASVPPGNPGHARSSIPPYPSGRCRAADHPAQGTLRGREQPGPGRSGVASRDLVTDEARSRAERPPGPGRRPHSSAPPPNRARARPPRTPHPRAPTSIQTRPRPQRRSLRRPVTCTNAVRSTSPAVQPRTCAGRRPVRGTPSTRSARTGTAPIQAHSPRVTKDDWETGTKHDVRELQVRCPRRNSWET